METSPRHRSERGNQSGCRRRFERAGLRPGITLTNLMIAVALIGIIAAVAGATLSTSRTDAVRDATYEIVQLFRRARAVAAQYNQAVVVVVYPYGSVIAEDGTRTRGRVEAFAASVYTCPSTRPTGTPYEVVDLGSFSGVDTQDGAGIAAVDNELDTDDACVRPNGRIINRADNDPFRPPGGDALSLAGKAHIWVQYNPVRLVGENLSLPVQEIEIPFNGLVRVPQ